MSQIEATQEALEMQKIANAAAAAARAENRRLGLASPFALNGKIFYELPDGTVTDVRPDNLKPPRQSN